MGTSLAAESLLSLAVTVTSEQRVDSVLKSIVQGLASQPGVALARIWLLPSVAPPAFTTLSRIAQMIFVSLEAQELPLVHQEKIGVPWGGTLLECRSVSEKLVK